MTQYEDYPPGTVVHNHYYAPSGNAPQQVTTYQNDQQRAAESASNFQMLQAAFGGVLQGLADFRPLIFQTQGFFFCRHVHSTDSLLQHPIFSNIRARCGVFESNMTYWRAAGKTDSALEAAYNDMRSRIMSEVEDIQYLIASRRPTFWEVVRDVLFEVFAPLIRYIAQSVMLRIGHG